MHIVFSVPDTWASVSVAVQRQNYNPIHGFNPIQGHSYSIECTVSITDGMNIPPRIQWFHSNGSVVKNGKRITVSVSRSNSSSVITSLLKFSPILSEDGGAYMCRAQITVPWMIDQPVVRSNRVSIVVSSK